VEIDASRALAHAEARGARSQGDDASFFRGDPSPRSPRLRVSHNQCTEGDRQTTDIRYLLATNSSFREARPIDLMKTLDDITGAIIDASIKLHINLGPGLLESVYEAVLARTLEKRGLRVERQKVVRFEYDELVFEEGFRVDLFVENRVVVELKSVEKLAPVHGKQVLTYLRLMKLPVGLLFNFGAPILKEGMHRIVNNLPASASTYLRVNRDRAAE
jgi:iron complex transport system substrate-binding protein